MATFGPWQVIRNLSEGGQAITYIVHEAGKSTGPENQFVLKRLKNPKRKERFERELSACLSLSHPNIAKVVAADLKNDPAYFVTEFYTGGSLEKAKERIKELPLRKRLEIFLGICNGVAHAHNNIPRIIHRDIKPDNVFLREPNLEPIIGDFGICFKEDGERLTLVDEAAGPRFYMAPELADGRAEDVEPSCDVYSLGKVLYWLLSGGTIFDREKHRAAKYDLSKDKLNPEFFMINAMLDKMIVEDPSKRFKDGSTVVREVERLLNRMDNNGHHIDIDTPQLCMFCAEGKYQITCDTLNTTRSSQQENDQQQAINNFGFTSYMGSQWIIMVCENCTHVALFRPDRAGGKTPWKRSAPQVRR